MSFFHYSGMFLCWNSCNLHFFPSLQNKKRHHSKLQWRHTNIQNVNQLCNWQCKKKNLNVIYLSYNQLLGKFPNDHACSSAHIERMFGAKLWNFKTSV